MSLRDAIAARDAAAAEIKKLESLGAELECKATAVRFALDVAKQHIRESATKNPSPADIKNYRDLSADLEILGERELGLETAISAAEKVLEQRQRAVADAAVEVIGIEMERLEAEAVARLHAFAEVLALRHGWANLARQLSGSDIYGISNHAAGLLRNRGGCDDAGLVGVLRAHGLRPDLGPSIESGLLPAIDRSMLLALADRLEQEKVAAE